MDHHAEHDHLEAIIQACAEACSSVPTLPTTQVLVVASEPCGCHVIGGTGGGSFEELLALLMHAARCIAEENGGSLTVSAFRARPGGAGAQGPAA